MAQKTRHKKSPPKLKGFKFHLFELASSDAVQIFKCNFQTGNFCFFRSTQPNPWIVVFFIRFVFAIRITNLALQVIMVFSFECTNTLPISPLRISIDIQFDDAIRNGFANFFNCET